MARKKASLSTTRRRSATLRPAPLAEPAVERTVMQPILAARPADADRDAIENRLLQLVSPHSRVLVVGCDTSPLSRSLSNAGCRVSVVEMRHDTLNLTSLDDAQFDAIVAVRLLEHVRDPIGMLTALGKHLSPDGGIVAAVPNVMHGKIRLGFLAGRSPAGLLSPDQALPSRWYDVTAVQRTFERAGFVITKMDRHIEAFDADALPLHGTPLPASVVDGLTRDADAMTRTFVIVAHPFPLAGQVRLDMRVRDLTQSQDRLAEQIRAIAQRTEDAVASIDRIGADVQRAAVRESELQPAIAAAHQRVTGNSVELATIRHDLKRFQYELLIPRLRTMVEEVIPPGAVVLVVSKGDDRLLAFSGRTGWHFLCTDQGQYAGHHPADSAAAIAALDRLRATGAGYLVIPQVALWWLDHYAGLREHLDRQARLVLHQDRTAVIYALQPSEAGQ